MIVVTGATGNVGGPLVRRLSEAGAKVRAVSRGLAPVHLPDGVEHRVGDLADTDSLRPAFDGADALFLLVSGAGAHVHAQELLDLARVGGVRRVLLLSSLAACTRPDTPSHEPLRTLERAVREAGVEWTILRPGGFHSNTMAWAESVRTRRVVEAPFGDVGLPTVDPTDIADVAAAALLDDGHNGRTYELTGPHPLTPQQKTAVIGAALGEPVRFVEQSAEQARTQMLGFMPPPVVEGTLAILGTPTPAEQRVSPHVEQVLGRTPRSFDDWVRRTLPAFR